MKKIYMLHPMINSVEQFCNFVKIPNDYSLVWDPKDPDYLIVSEWIYTSKAKTCYQEFLALQNEKRVNIFFAGEAISPDLNFFDYAIVFNRNLSCNDRIIRMPTIDYFRKRLSQDFYNACPDPVAELKNKTGFCNFIYTNPNAHPRRDQLFHKLSSYKKVDALGMHLRNVDLTENFVDEKVKRNYKFTIACENATFDGYTSEKLLTALQAYTVPIYWGDPSVADFFNQKRFINTNNMTLDELLETVKKIDADDKLWCKMVSEPVMTDRQQQEYEHDHQAYLDFWKGIFSQDIKDAKRIGFGFYPQVYRDFMSGLVNTETKYKRGWFFMLGRIICCFIPIAKYRRKLRQKFIGK